MGRFRDALASPGPAAIAEIKRRSPSASTARAVSPSDGLACTTAASSASAPMIGMAAPMTGAASSGTNRASVNSTASAMTTPARAIQARRTMRRSQRRRR